MAMDIGENEGFDESSALSILQRMIELLTDTELNPMNRADDADGSENEAEARLNWGGRDLYDISIKRV